MGTLTKKQLKVIKAMRQPGSSVPSRVMERGAGARETEANSLVKTRGKALRG